MSTRWSSFAKQLSVVIGLAIFVWLLLNIRILWTPLILIFILAFLTSYPVNAILRRTGWPRTLVVIVTYLFLLLFVALAAINIVPRLMALGTGLVQTVRRVLYELSRVTPAPIEITPSLVLDLREFYAPIQQSILRVLNPDPVTLESVQNFLFPFASGAAAVVISAVSGLLGALFVIVSSFYLVKDWPHIGRFLLTRLPAPYRPELLHLWREIAAVWDGFVRGQLLAGIIMGIMVGLMLSVLGVRNAMALGLLAAVAEFLPAIGPAISATTGTLIALTFGSAWLPFSHLGFALVVLAFYLVLGQIQNLYVVPRIVGRRMDLHPLVIIVGVLIGAELLGILGMLLAAPTIASARVLVGYVFNKLLDQEPFPAPRRSDPQERWRALLAGRPVRAVLFDLDGTLIETDDEVVEALARRLHFLEKLLPVAARHRIARRILMAAEPLINGLVTLCDRLKLGDLLFRFNATLNRWRGIRPQERFVAVAGAVESVMALADRYPIGIVTSRNRQESQAFLAQCGLADRIAVLISRDDSGRLKPHPQPILRAAQKLGVPAEYCVMVGDTSVDVRAARAAGALAIGVLCGFGDEDDLKDADLILKSTAQVAECL